MTSTRLRRARLGSAAAGLLTITLVPGLAQLPALADPATPRGAAPSSVKRITVADDLATLADSVTGLAKLDLRGSVLPTVSIRRAAAKLGGVDLRFNQFGTPESVLPADGVLATGFSKDPAQAPAAARSYLAAHATAFGLTRSQVAALDLVNSQRFAQSSARAVLFRQHTGALTPALDSMVTVGVANGEIAYVSSSLTRLSDTSALSKTPMSPLAGWLKAATNVGVDLTRAERLLIKPQLLNGWTSFKVPGLAVTQQARLRSLVMADGVARPVIEANVVQSGGADVFGYTLMIDALSGKVLHRQNQLLNENDSSNFSGSITPAKCGPKHGFAISDNTTKTIVATAAEANTVNDIVVKLFGPTGTLLASSDSATSPEAATASSALGFPKGTYTVQVCPFASPTVPALPPYNYAAAALTSNTGTVAGSSAGSGSEVPRWRWFSSTPSLSSLGSTKPGNSSIVCWFQRAKPCTYPLGSVRNVQAVGPWDTLAGVPTQTTVGNNANTHEAWINPLAPGGLAQAPVSASRTYTTPFTDAWNQSKCALTEFVPGGNDINASVTDLFVTHNIMHDYSYYLGFTEANYNLQVANFGRSGRGQDPEVGNAQAGAIDGGSATTGLGRDNANQIALQDGVPGITNQYLFQPLAGAFYAPCTDGSLDFGIVGHEYTHAISNRMVGGPDEGLTSEQGGAMGESWSDLNAAEYLFSHGQTPKGLNPFAVGVYATQNKKVAIRDYSINQNPLNYSDYGFDSPGPEVHADGEIWNGTQWSVRQSLVTKYNKQFPYSNKALQLKCSQATATSSPLPAFKCPGNKRWIQLVYDAWLLQPGATSMLTARDAMLAADRMRFKGRDLSVMWKAFASRGMGKGAHIKTADDTDPKPSFATPYKKQNGTVVFKNPNFGKVYVGEFQARVTPVADTSFKTKTLGSTVKFAAGTYRMLFTSQTRGATRFTIKVKPGQRQVVNIKSIRDLAAKKSGGRIIGSTPGSRNPQFLIDSTELTNWGGVTAANVDSSHPFVSVDLAGGVSTIRRAQVSAYLRPAPASATDLPILVGPAQVADPDSASRFTALRQFALEACVAKCATAGAKWKRFYTSSPKAFPGTLPRPVAPDLTLRSFSFKPVRAAAVRLVTLENQCTGNKQYAGEQDADPTNATDCKTASDRGTIVHAAELQIFGK